MWPAVFGCYQMLNRWRPRVTSRITARCIGRYWVGQKLGIVVWHPSWNSPVRFWMVKWSQLRYSTNCPKIHGNLNSRPWKHHYVQKTHTTAWQLQFTSSWRPHSTLRKIEYLNSLAKRPREITYNWVDRTVGLTGNLVSDSCSLN